MANASRKRRINVIDVLIIMLVLALLATVGYRIYDQVTDNSGDKKSDLVVLFESGEEYRAILGALNEGDKVYLCSDGTLLGFLYDNAEDDLAAIYELDSGNGAEGIADAYERIRFGGMIELSAQANEAENGGYVVIGNRNISVGSEIEVYTEKATFTITVKSINENK